MADEMVNGNGNTFDPMASWARLSERVENQGKDIIDLRSNMNTGFQGVNANLAALSNELRSSGKTQWPVIWSAIGVGVVILSGLGFMALQPIKDNNSRLEDAMSRMAETAVTQKDLEYRSTRSSEDRKRSDDALTDLRINSVSRNEWTERNRARDQEVLELNRRVDELRQDVGAVYGTRDVIQDMKKEIDDLRARRFQPQPTGG
ncbi:hypothetical protein Rleg9DRAFT_1679 [Rhizobium leguminosarum bv. trifolii WSM597]|uniref:Uncharacterized protein n=1 Tax=Rhizobium leguminosarum bv. trifolii WSM597 TaxID=754764 RepID=J0GYW2_RHILT|nr:hypothetical protein [Rhizobium leguminosarum]EJB02865.1 hypothetical protein Rleg9DRAFT_1679 [Rhizobium leguminosarum bv. trifolii WSM597]